ncbi:hypothetical protein HB664_16435 [Enterobacter sp. DNB-S2]|uniref:hypothetical protein n=1 Tax=Enterobacter sp. DNB-S2 TaxID=2720029 RepID=UPI001C63539D|nr:hypothetical protein [Enterobacter sp. DNB-S2]QYH17559.1 hypothetical protein HB664_16435 [Enterobacter sp. DNB-S2]
MSDNPFTKIVNDTLMTTSKIDKAIADLEKYLEQASEALNTLIIGPNHIKLTTNVPDNTLPAISSLMISFMSTNQKGKKYIYLTNDIKSEMIAGWAVSEDGDSMSLIINKLKSSYPVSEDGYIKSIGELLTTTSIMDKAIELRKEVI